MNEFRAIFVLFVMNIFISGASGFIGQALTRYLLAQGHSVTAVSRSPNRISPPHLRWVGWDSLAAELPKHDAVIHLAGENAFGGLWTASMKQRILESRVLSTRKIAAVLKSDPGSVKTWISGSAVGFYGDAGSAELTESSPAGTGFLADVCKAWEQEALSAEHAVTVSIPRIGVVLEKDGGALGKMIPQFNLFLGGPAGGAQFVPWIHRADLIRSFDFALSHPLPGPWNACAPAPVTMSELAEELGRALHRPSLFKAPAFLLKIALGEASSALLASERAVPKRLQEAGFTFSFPELSLALSDIIRS